MERKRKGKEEREMGTSVVDVAVLQSRAHRQRFRETSFR